MEKQVAFSYPSFSVEDLSPLDKDSRALLEAGKHHQFFDRIIESHGISPAILEILPQYARTNDRYVERPLVPFFPSC